MTVTFAPVVAWPLVVVVSLALAWLVIAVYRARLAGYPPQLRVTLTTLRMAMWAVLTLAMLRPSLQWTEPDERPSVLKLVADTSRSMTVADAAANKSRYQALLDLVEQNASLLAGDERIEFELFEFDSSLRRVDKLRSSPEGEWTNIGDAISQLSEGARGQRVLGAVLFSDGANRTPKSSGGAAIGAAQQFAEQTGASVHSVVFGSPDLSAGGVDLAIESLAVDPLAFVKKTVPVQAKVRLSGFAGRTTQVRVLLEDRTGLSEGETGELKPLPLTVSSTPLKDVTTEEGDVVIPVDLSFVANEPGEFKIRVEVKAADDEAQLANNSRDALITVRKNGLKVAYFDTARWEKRFLGRINKTARIQLDYIFVPDAESLLRMQASRNWFDPGEYDVFLIGDVPPELFAAESEFAVGLLSRVRAGSGLGLICGSKLLSRRPPGFLADVLPATWRGSDPRVREEGFRLTPTSIGLGSYVLRGVAEKWTELKPLERVFDIRPRNDIVPVLAETPEGEPLLIAAETGRSRTAVLATADTWLWFTSGEQQVHQRFWQQFLLWLGRKDQDSEKPIWVTAAPRTIDQGQPFTITYGARTAEGEPRGDVSFALQVTKPDGSQLPLVGGAGESPQNEFEETAQAGDYFVTVKGKTPEGTELEASTRVLVNRRDAELDSPAADPSQLEQVAAASGGITLAPEAFRGWLEDLIQANKESNVVKLTSIPLWDGWPLLVIFVTLLVSEWTIRRLRGLV